MKKIITSIAIVTLVTFYLSSCKKSDTHQPQTTLQKIQGTWLLQSVVYNDHSSGADHTDTTAGTSTDHFDFRTDGKIYYSLSGSKDTVTYSLPGDTKILINGTDTYDIKTLTSNAFIIYKKEMFGASDYEEETIIWKK